MLSHKTLLTLFILLLVNNCSKKNISENVATEGNLSNTKLDTDPSDNSNTIIQYNFTNNPSKMKSLFESFDGVSTSSDSNYFYVSSNGIPSHNMMEGITNWQQQIPIPQDYSEDNKWSIPIKPEFSDNPLSSKTNFMKGAMAIAVNGIPIFNPLNNRGEDANLIGELDKWGGHCGKADDYHYHLPPIHLIDFVGEENPIAYSLDGFPIFGNTEKILDENLGVLNSDGSYKYHSIEQYPYFIANMKGKVTTEGVSPENQIIPQPKTKSIRPSLTPLKGAEIIKFTETGDSSFQLTYKLNNDIFTIDYYWDNLGHFYLTFTDSSGNSVTENYHR